MNQRKWPDQRHWHFDADFLGTDTHGTWMFMPESTVLQRGDEPTRRAGVDCVLLVPYHEPWIVEFYRDHPHRDIYINIGSIPEWGEYGERGVQVTQIDLDLDVVVTPGGTVIVEDEGEFLVNQSTLDYPDHVIELARIAADRAKSLAEARKAPFDGTDAMWWPSTDGGTTSTPEVPRLRYVIDLEDEPTAESDATTRQLTAQDVDALAELMINAYRGTIDFEGERLSDARTEVESWLASSAMTEHSFATVHNDELTSAVLVMDTTEGPLVRSVFTRPDSKQRGLARAAVAAACRSLKRAGYRELILYIAEGNVPSERLFARLGATRG